MSRKLNYYSVISFILKVNRKTPNNKQDQKHIISKRIPDTQRF